MVLDQVAAAVPPAPPTPPDQAQLRRQLAPPFPDPGALAASWRAMVCTHAVQRQAIQQGEPWRFGVHAGERQPLWLKLVATDGAPAHQPRGRSARIALRLEASLPGLGQVAAQMEAVGGAIHLELAAARPAALPHLRGLLPALHEAIARAGLVPRRCKVAGGLPVGSLWRHCPTGAQAAALAQPLFLAMAEIALLLAHTAPPPAAIRAFR